MIKVYTTPSCVQCNQTKKILDQNSIPYEAIDLSTDAEAMTMVKAMGYSSAPVVVTENSHWSGFRLEKLKDYIATHKEKHDTINP